MSDYDSGDDLLDGLDAETLIASSQNKLNKRPRSSSSGLADEDEPSNKRAKVEAPIQDDNDDQRAAVARKVLKDKFEYDDFRHEQAAAITSILRGDNVLVVFPTGAGKSLCYQIPGIAFEQLDALGIGGYRSGRAADGAGLTIVVSPLIALMKDQVDVLLRRNISAACLDSTKTQAQQQEINLGIRQGRLRLLYCAPERLNNETFVANIKFVPGGIRLVAVDEAHCISEWGQSFRPDYLKVARFVKEVRAERVVCLTATATPRVADDVCKAFDIEKRNMFRTSPYRSNLQLLAEPVDEKDKYQRLVKFLRKHPGPTLVYITLQKDTEELSRRLNTAKFKTAPFHAGLPTEVKTQVQDDFMAGKIPIIVATIAFGMGIDKADIRNVVHYDLASSIEEYSQQVGRAGRDGQPSTCMLYLCQSDFYLRENFARGDLPARQSLYNLLSDLFHRQTEAAPDGSGDEVIKLNITALGRDYDMRNSPLSILLATLELRFGLLRSITPEYSTYQFEPVGSYYNSVSKSDTTREGKAIAANATKARRWWSVDVNTIHRSTGILRGDLIRKLQSWNDSGVLQLKASGVENRYKILKTLPRLKKEIEELTDKLYVDMQARERDALNRTEQVISLLSDKKCFARGLAEYFGMGLPNNQTQCGHCTSCLSGGTPIVLPPKPEPSLDIQGIKKILEECNVRDDPRFLARVAFGIKSPRVSQLFLDKKTIFGSLATHDFDLLLREFTRACEAQAGQPLPPPPPPPPPSKTAPKPKASAYSQRKAASPQYKKQSKPYTKSKSRPTFYGRR